jgi:ribosome-binding factor A
MAFKKERLEKIIEREVGTILLMEVKDDRLHFVTITSVTLTGDLSIATIYYTVFGSPEQVNATTEVLLEAKGYIKGLLSRRLEVRKIPELIFKYDQSYVEGNKIEEILRQIKKG